MPNVAPNIAALLGLFGPAAFGPSGGPSDAFTRFWQSLVSGGWVNPQFQQIARASRQPGFSIFNLLPLLTGEQLGFARQVNPTQFATLEATDPQDLFSSFLGASGLRQPEQNALFKLFPEFEQQFRSGALAGFVGGTGQSFLDFARQFPFAHRFAQLSPVQKFGQVQGRFAPSTRFFF